MTVNKICILNILVREESACPWQIVMIEMTHDSIARIVYTQGTKALILISSSEEQCSSVR